MGWFDSINSGFKLTTASFKVVLKEPHLLALPLASGLIMLFVIALFFIPAFIFTSLSDSDFYWVFACIMISFISFFLIYFTQFMIVGVAKKRFEGQDPTFMDGFNTAVKHLPAIFAFAVVGTILEFITKSIEQSNNKIIKYLGGIIMSLIGAAWTVVTYLSVPVIVHENVGLLQSFKRSGEIVKTSFGEGLTMVVGVSVLFTVLIIAGFIIAILGLLLSFFIGIIGLLLCFAGIFIILCSVLLQKVVTAILGEALYYYSVNKKYPEGFDM